MGKLALNKSLTARLRAIHEQYKHSRDTIDWSNPEVAASHEMAIQLQLKVRQAVERWIETVKDHDTAPISNALLAVSSDLLEMGLRTATNDPTVRSGIAAKYLQRFMHNGIESGLIAMPELPEQEATAPKKNGLLGPDGSPLM